MEQLNKATCEEIIKILINYSKHTNKENKPDIETACLIIQIAGNTSLEIPVFSEK